MSKAKRQGTAHETWIATSLRDHGHNARRLPEGGANDEGDVEVITASDRWVLEGKARQTLNVQETLAKTRAKAEGHPVAVIWKRLVRRNGKQVRQPVAGERVVVILGWDDFVDLFNRAYPSQKLGDNVQVVDSDNEERG